MVTEQWLLCPVCGNKTRLKIVVVGSFYRGITGGMGIEAVGLAAGLIMIAAGIRKLRKRKETDKRN